jgi:hypothetical protein
MCVFYILNGKNYSWMHEWLTYMDENQLIYIYIYIYEHLKP